MYYKGDIVLVKPLQSRSSSRLSHPDLRMLLIDKVNNQNSPRESFTGRILAQKMNFALVYGYPLYRCVDKLQIHELVLPAREVEKQLPHLNQKS